MNGDEFSAGFLGKIKTRLQENKRVRYDLPYGGRIHIDRQLPFLCVYRNPSVRQDDGTERLVISQPSYILATGKQAFHDDLVRLIETVVQTLQPVFGAFWVLEIWSHHDPNDDIPEIPTLKIDPPAIEIRLSSQPQPAATLPSLKKHLSQIKIQKVKTGIAIIEGEKIAPPRLSPLLQDAQLHTLNCHLFGLRVRPIYRADTTGDLLPQVHRSFTRQFTTALQRIFYDFAVAHTSYHPKHYHFMGRRAVVKALWEIDAQLAEISQSYSLLLQVTPVNTDAAWEQFKAADFGRVPVFQYRPIPFDVALIKRQLWNIRIEKLEDPVIESLIREKRREIDAELTMLMFRNTSRFLYAGLQLYGNTPDALVNTAHKLLAHIRALPEQPPEPDLTAEAFAQIAAAEIERYRQAYPPLASRVEIRDDLATMMVAGGDLLINRQYRIPQGRVAALLSHEIGTHIVTTYNGRAQKLRQLAGGLAGYQPLQEGLAVLSEYLVGGLSIDRVALLAGRVLAVKALIDGADFLETFRMLTQDSGFDERTAYTITMRVYRGGGFVKDAVYLSGLIDLLDYVRGGGTLKPLFVGKLAARHIPIVQELQRRGVLQPPPLLPHYMSDAGAQARLKLLRDGGFTVFDLLPDEAAQGESF